VAAGTVTVVVQHAQTRAKGAASRFAGYATPEASVQSVIWAASNGDLDKLSAGVTDEVMAGFKGKMAGKSEDETRRGLMAWASAMKDYKITQKDVVTANEVHLHIHATPSAEALHSGKSVIVMRKIGNEWKQAGDVN